MRWITAGGLRLGTVHRLLVVAVITVVAAISPSSLAWAAEPASVRVNGPKGYAVADWDWSAVNHMDDVNIYVEDTACNGQGPYAYFRVDADTNFSTTFRRDLDNGCAGAGTGYNGLDVGPLQGETIYSVQFVICEDDPATGRPLCEESASVANPLVSDDPGEGDDDPAPECPTIYGDDYTKYLTVRWPLPDESLQRITWQAKFDCHGNPTGTAPTLLKVGNEHFVQINLGHRTERENQVTYPGLIQDCFISGNLGGCQTEGSVSFTATLSGGDTITYEQTVETNDFGRFNTWGGHYELTDDQVCTFPYGC